MRFGDHIRDMRRARGWTQPEASGRIGIEQSYLSKLESGKSYPSEDVFAALLSVYDLDTDALAEKLFPGELDRLREIGQVRASLLRREQDQQSNSRRWLVAGIALLTIGGGSLGISLLGSDQTIDWYQYKSESLVAAEVDSPSDIQDGSLQSTALEYRELDVYQDVVFLEPVPEGRRVWRFYGSRSETRKSPLRWFLVPAFMTLFGGFGCFFASYRLR